VVFANTEVRAEVLARLQERQEEETTNEAKFDSAPPMKVLGEAQNIGRLITCVNVTNTKRSTGKSPYEPRKIDRADFPGLGDRDIISAPVSPPRVDFKALGFGPRFLPRPELFPIQGCSQDPATYLCEDGDNCRASEKHTMSSTRWLDRPNGNPIIPPPLWHIGPAHNEPSPFGALLGLETDVGIVKFPEMLFGWKYESGTGRDTKWVMMAC